MSEDLHPLWNEPAPDAPALQRDAYRLMMQLLWQSRSRIPDALIDLSPPCGKRILEACIGAASRSTLSQPVRTAALEMLQRRLRTIDPATPTRMFLPQRKHVNPLSPTFGERLEMRERFSEAVNQFVRKHRNRWGISAEPGDASNAATKLSREQAIGLFLSMLILRAGQCDPTLLGLVLQNLAHSLVVAGRWAWIDVVIPESIAGTAQLRRVLMDPACVAAWRIATLDGVPEAPPLDGAAERRDYYRAEARRCFREFVAICGEGLMRNRPLELDELCRATRDWLHIHSVPLLATYAAGDLASSSLTADTWLRLIRYGWPDGEFAPAPVAVAMAPTATFPIPSSKPSAEDVDQDRLDAGDLDDVGAIADLRRILQSDRGTWGPALESLATALGQSDGSPTTASMIIRWVCAKATTRKANGDPRSDSTIRNLQSLIINRLLSVLPDQLITLDQDELTERYQVIVESGRSRPQQGRINAALREFDAYVRKTFLPDLPASNLPGFEGTAYSVSSRIMVEWEYEAALAMCKDGTVNFERAGLANQCGAFLVLGFRLGLRRGEILGLQVGDLRWGSESVLYVRKNPHRGLKTNNAERVLPLFVLTHKEQDLLRMLCNGRPSDAFLFFDNPPTTKELERPLVVDRINDLLFRVTGDPALHPHNLRHSFPTLTIIGMVGPDIHIGSHPYAENWMRHAIHAARRVEAAISGKLHYFGGRAAALGVALGHGIETTSHQHYVHAFDVLLFFACNCHQYKESEHARDRFRRGEVSLITALAGYAPVSRINSSDPAALLRTILKHTTASVVFCEPLSPRSESIDPTTAGPLPTLARLLDHPVTRCLPGRPNHQSERDSANHFLEALRDLWLANGPDLHEQMKDWATSAHASNGWASFSPSEAKLFVGRWKQCARSLVLEVKHVDMPKKQRSESGKRMTKRQRIGSKELGNALRRKRGRLLIRVKDSRPSGQAKPGAISWVMRGLAALPLQPKET